MPSLDESGGPSDQARARSSSTTKGMSMATHVPSGAVFPPRREAAAADEAGTSRREVAEATLARAEHAARSRAAPAVPNPEVEHDAEPDPHSVARSIVLRQLTLGPRSRAQLAGTLRRRGCADEVAEAILDRMAEVGLVDDAAYAQLLVESRRRTKGLAGAALRKELRDKGVDDELAVQALGSRDPLAERARAEDLVERKLRTMAGLDPQAQARRLAAMLARKGYPADTAYAVVRDAVNAAPEHRRD